jgi:hypothetical protein
MLRRVNITFSVGFQLPSPKPFPLFAEIIRREIYLGGFFSRKPIYGGPMPKFFGFLRLLFNRASVFSVSRWSFSAFFWIFLLWSGGHLKGLLGTVLPVSWYCFMVSSPPNSHFLLFRRTFQNINKPLSSSLPFPGTISFESWYF